MQLNTLNQVKCDMPAASGDDAIILPFPTPPAENRKSSLKAAATWVLPVARRFTKFGFVGASGMAVDLGLYGLLLAALPQGAARAAAIAVAMTWNFVWNRRVTFADARQHTWLRQYAGYCTSCLFGAFVNWGTSLTVGSWHPLLAEHPIVAAMIGVVVGMVFNFAFCLMVVFRTQAKEPIADRIIRPRTPRDNARSPTRRSKPRLAIRRS